MTFIADDFLEVAVLERLNELFAEVAGLRGVALTPLDLSRGTATVPTASFINTIERNLEQLGAAGTKVWLGEDSDAVWLDYRDVNRWFNSLELLRRI